MRKEEIQMKRFTLTAGGIAVLVVLLAAAALTAQASGLAQSSTPAFEDAQFSHPLDITNPYMPLKPETTFVYKGKSDGVPTRQEFVVTDQTKTILGVEARVVVDTNWEGGKLIERTEDWFAQDDEGNVWYLGEFATEYEDGEVIGHEGSWEAGVDGAQPGIVMKANPVVGETYAQENAPGIAEDMATVLSLTESVCVRYGCLSNVLQTAEVTPLEPGNVEHKFYAPGVGQIKTVKVEGGEEQSQLVKILRDGDGSDDD
jgi:hypothetical protein